MHCGRRRLLRRGLEFHVYTINKSAHTKKVWKLIVSTSYSFVCVCVCVCVFVCVCVCYHLNYFQRDRFYEKTSQIHSKSGRLIDLNSMSTHQGLFHAQKLEYRVHCPPYIYIFDERSIWSIHNVLTGTSIPVQSLIRDNGNKDILHTPQISRAGASMSYPCYPSWRGPCFSAGDSKHF